MVKKLALSMGCMALMTSLSCLAHADGISFQPGSSSTKVTATATGLSTTTSGAFLVSASPSGASEAITAALTIFSTGPSADFTMAAVTGTGATYANGTAVPDVEITSASCTGGADPGVCLLGSLNGGNFTATPGGQGSFSGLFNVYYVSPSIMTFFGAATFTSSGSDSLNISNSVFTGSPLTSVVGGFSGADVTVAVTGIPNPTPEPDTLVLFGSGLLGMAGMIRRKLIASR